jgi:hypothetical protein
MSNTKDISRFPRRSFLKGAAGAAVALPFLESAQKAQAADMPLRLVIYVSGQGTLPSLWTPATTADNSLQLSEMLQPLKSHQSKMTVISGVSNLIAPLHMGTGHVCCGHTLMNAALIDTTRTGSFDKNTTALANMLCLGPSVDHYLASKLGGPTPLNLAVGDTNSGENKLWYKVKASGAAGANPEAPLDNNPVNVFKANLGSVGTSSGPAPVLSRADKFRAQRGSVLDAVQGSFKYVTSKVSQADKIRLQMHADSLRSIESKLSYVPPTTCKGLTQTLPSGFKQPTYPSWARLDLEAQAMMDIAVNVLACGANRIVTIQDTNYDSPSFDFLPTGPVMGWHAQVHNDPSLKLGYSDASQNPTLKAGFQYYGSVFSKLLDRMDAVVEPNGKTMLDNSLAIWISEFGDGRIHSGNDLPIVFAGGAGGKIAGNRHLTLKATTGDLWTTVLNIFGVPATSFGYNGAAGLNNGPIGLITS